MLRAMGRPQKEAASPSALAAALVRFIAARGEGASVLDAIGPGFAEDAARDADEISITPTALAAILRVASEVLADPHAALRLPAELPMRRYDAVALAARAARTPREILALVARYAPLVFPHLEATIEEDDLEVRFAARVAGQPRGLGHHVDEYLLAFVLGHCRRGGAVIDPLRVWLSSARPHTLEPLFVAAGTREVGFGAADTGLALAVADADRELPGADPMMLATAQHLASAALATAPRAGAFAAVVGARIEAILPGDASTEAVAAALHMSARTLQRRLEDEGTRFSEVLDAVRERVSRALVLDEALALGEVGYRVGFSDAATFSRAFKRWTGLPPGAYRRRRGG
jgi:AraC-like DNA-binding protein